MINLTITKMPLINQRMDFEHYHRILQTPAFRSQFSGDFDRDFECGTFVWGGVNEGATVLLQRIVLGLEAWIPVAVTFELACQKRLTRSLLANLSNPFSIGPVPKSIVECYYNRAPALIDKRHALSHADPKLSRLVHAFYRDIRNKIFHGHYVTDPTPEKLDEIFAVFARVYKWCDSWCNVVARINEQTGALKLIKE